jgi:hypothetical protein
MNFQPRHIGHWFELLRTLAALAQVTLTTFIALKVFGLL